MTLAAYVVLPADTLPLRPTPLQIIGSRQWRSLALLPIYNGVIVLKLPASALALSGRPAPLFYFGQRSFSHGI